MRSDTRPAPRWPAIAGWAILGLATAPVAGMAAGPAKPNIIVILADDLGHADLGFQGCRDIPTPHIDSLARDGVRCRNGYVSGPYCSPTRAGLMTGRYQQRFGHEFNPGGAGGVNRGLPLGETTLADRLKAAGYVTGMVGKWHLGEDPRFRPRRRGFDEFFGFLGGAHPYFPGRGAPIYRDDEVVREKEYLTDAFGREAVAFIRRHKDRPFFLYLAFNAVHTPMDATDARLARFAAISDTSRHTYAAMLAAMDEAVGRVLDALRTAGLEEDTLICFLSDNGGPTMLGTTINASRNDPFRGSKRTTLEGGIHVPFVVRWKGKLPAGRVYDQPVIQLDILPTALAAARPDWRLDGVDLLPHLRGEVTAPPHDALFWRMGEQMAVRCGDWKVVRYDEAADHTDVRSAGSRVKVTPPRLYNLADDPAERFDLAGERPERLRELSDLWKSWNAHLARPLWGPGSARTAAERRPNVLFIAVDDLNDWVGCLGGHPQAVTPNIDRLARRGTLFTNAHCQAPLCNPSRSSLLTGLRPTTTGIYALEPGIRAVASLKDRFTLPQDFAAHGYATATFGKVFHDGSIPPAGRAREFGVWGEAGRMPLPKEKFVHTPEDIAAMDWGAFPGRDEDSGDWKIADAAIAYLRGLTGDRPFFLAVGFRLPHVPCFAPKKWFDLIPEASLAMPPVKDDDRDDVPTFAWFLHWKLPEPRLSWLRKADQWRPLVRAYLASTSFMDSQVGRVLEALDAAGRAGDTVVVLWSDHGWHLGEKGITGKNTLWERSTRVPLIFAGPGVAAGSTCGRPAELLDLYPTLLELCGLPARAGLEGHSLVPQLKDPDAPRAWPAVTTHNPGNHSVRSERWRYIRYADGSEELYDHRDDPNEWTNLAHDPSLAEVKRDHARWLPTKEASPAPGSVTRHLIREDGVWYWENRPIVPGEEGRRAPKTIDDRRASGRNGVTVK